MALLTQSQLKVLVHYCSETGAFTWNQGRRGCTTNTPCGSSRRNGYVVIQLNRRLYRAHRIAWLYVHGVWPPHDIDHRNRVRSDNRIKNLRCATRSQNNLNSKLRRDNPFGYKNVTYHRTAKKYEAQVQFNKVNKKLGFFDTAAEAAHVAARYRERVHKDFYCHG